MPSIAAIDARCFLDTREPPLPQASDLDWAWARMSRDETGPPARRPEPSPPTLHSLIVRHFGLAAA